MPDSPHITTNRPSDITLDRNAHELRITWKRDGHLSVYPLDALREACPCASCRGGHDRMGPEYDPDLIELTPARSYDVTRAELVGKYALQLFFSDGHSSGIYTWDYLRRLCPCDACREARRRGEMP
jgi:DUF971 family protein